VRTRTHLGRPDATSHAAIERAAFKLFARDGFEGTTLDAIAAELGVGRRTLFNYYPSKNDIPWGQFDRTLDGFRSALAGQPSELPVWEAVHRGVVDFNRFPDDAQPSHRDRMRLLLGTPALQAHAVLRYQEWRRIIADFVGDRLQMDPGELLPRTVAHLSLALALESYESWLADDNSDLISLLTQAMTDLRSFLTEGPELL